MNNFFLELTKNSRRLYRFSMIYVLISLLLSIISYLYLDLILADFFANPNNYSYWIFAREITNIGLGENYFAALFILLAYVQFFNPSFKVWLKPWLLRSFAVLLGSGICLRILKLLFGRKRPHVEPRLVENIFDPFNWHWDFQSMPSGHTQVLFSVAVMLSVLKPKWLWLWFALATIFSFTRVMTYDHFLSDVIMGSAVGVVGSLVTLKLLNKFIFK